MKSEYVVKNGISVHVWGPAIIFGLPTWRFSVRNHGGGVGEVRFSIAADYPLNVVEDTFRDCLRELRHRSIEADMLQRYGYAA